MATRQRDSVWGYACLGVLGVLLVLVLWRCWSLQNRRCEEFQQRAAYQQRLLIPQSARRGLIVDRNGKKLAISVRVPSVAVDAMLLEDREAVSKQLAGILGLDTGDLYCELQANQERGKRFVWVKRFVSEDQAEQVRAMTQRGVMVKWEFVRRYPMGPLAGHVLGFCDIDGRGMEGVESYYDEYLAGRGGWLVLQSDALRRPIGVAGECEDSEDGKTLVLSLDVYIQEVVERQLQLVAEQYQARSAVGVVMDPGTGEILALGNWPGFDPARAREVDSSVRRNRALTDPVEPGSTFKPFTVAAALEGGYVTVNQKIDCLEGPYEGKGIGRIGEYKQYFGVISVGEIIMRSSNIGAAKIAQKMGKKYFYGKIKEFGFGQKTGIDLSGEGAGILSPLEQWKWGQYALTRAAYGQGPISTTAVQLVRGFSCFANGGWLVRPHVGRWVLDGEEIVKDCGEGEYFRVISERVVRSMVEEVLVKVVEDEHGTAHNAYLEGYRVFGKTGTAKIARKDGRGYEENKYVSSFIAGAPVERPRICVLVMVREPDRSLGLGYTGGKVAGPAVREIIRETLGYLGVERQISDEVAVVE